MLLCENSETFRRVSVPESERKANRRRLKVVPRLVRSRDNPAGERWAEQAERATSAGSSHAFRWLPLRLQECGARGDSSRPGEGIRTQAAARRARLQAWLLALLHKEQLAVQEGARL